MARVMVEVPLSLAGGIKMQNFSVWSLMHGHFKQSVCSCVAVEPRPPVQPADTWEEGGEWQGEAVLRHRQQGLTLTAIWETETNTQHIRHHKHKHFQHSTELCVRVTGKRYTVYCIDTVHVEVMQLYSSLQDTTNCVCSLGSTEKCSYTQTQLKHINTTHT